jgi:hypothetical protein
MYFIVKNSWLFGNRLALRLRAPANRYFRDARFESDNSNWVESSTKCCGKVGPVSLKQCNVLLAGITTYSSDGGLLLGVSILKSRIWPEEPRDS